MVVAQQKNAVDTTETPAKHTAIAADAGIDITDVLKKVFNKTFFVFGWFAGE